MNAVRYRGQTTTGPSYDIWHDCPVLEIAEDPSKGYGFFDDFLDYSSTASGTMNKHGLPTFEGDCTLTGDATQGGHLVAFGTTDNEAASLRRGGGVSGPFLVPAASTSSTAKKLWFEARVKQSALTDDLGTLFIGLAEPTGGALDFVADDGADFADLDFIGFEYNAADGNLIKSLVSKAAGTLTSVDATFAVPVADAYMKLGFKYDPGAAAAKRIKFYLDGAEQTTYVGEASGDATVYLQDTTNFPGGEGMSGLFHLFTSSGSDYTATMDWWRAFQLR